MKDKSKQVWYLYAHDIKKLKGECYEIISKLYVQLGQVAEAEIIVEMTKLFCKDLYTNYGSMELDEVRFAINKHIRENDGPHFVNVPMWNQALRSYKKTKALKKQTNQIDQYEIYKKRVDTMRKALNNREIIKIGKGNSDKYKYD